MIIFDYPLLTGYQFELDTQSKSEFNGLTTDMFILILMQAFGEIDTNTESKYHSTPNQDDKTKQRSSDIEQRQANQIAGWLQKLGQKVYFTESWKRVFVTIGEGKLVYHTDQRVVKGVLDFRLYKASLVVQSKSGFKVTFQMKNDELKSFLFQTEFTKDLSDWISVLSENLCLQQEQVRPGLRFWKVGQISSDELITTAQTGDIVLFSGKSLTDCMVRSVTGSQYDHVGVLIKYPLSGQVVLFESLAGKGVCCWDWKSFQKSSYWKDNYTRVVYRRLLGVQRDDCFNNKVNHFQQITMGKEYRINPTDILTSERQRNKCSIENKTGFFCSELVASLFQYLELLPCDRDASEYWPGNFSLEYVNKAVTLEDDAFFSEEMEINFDI